MIRRRLRLNCLSVIAYQGIARIGSRTARLRSAVGQAFPPRPSDSGLIGREVLPTVKSCVQGTGEYGSASSFRCSTRSRIGTASQSTFRGPIFKAVVARNILNRVVLFSLLLGGVSEAAASEPDLFVDRVAPVLVRRCLNCHNDTTRKGGFSLASASDLVESGFVDADDPEASYLLELVTPDEGHAEMPKEGDPLEPDELAAMREWIGAGAAWPEEIKLTAAVVADRDWWSLKPLNAPKLPGDGSQNPVDAFVDEKLAEEGLAPVAEADWQTLIRRVTYDLTGLPPTPAEIGAFRDSTALDPDAAWESLVDRLLASPAFGEKFAQHWLDIARYAETHGYDKDKPRDNAWPYRDYVIRSFNDDKPYSRFVQEQIAGDVLYSEDPDGVIALGFLAAGPWDFIGHWEVGEAKLDGRIAKHFDRDEMVSAVFNVFQSTTVQCAQCHHHKFDPIRADDYYRLHAVFAAVDRADRLYAGLTPEQQRERDAIDDDIDVLQRERDQLKARVAEILATHSSSVTERIRELEDKQTLPLKPQYGYHSQIEASEDVAKWLQVDLGHPHALSQIELVAAFDNFAGIGSGFGFPVRFRVEVSNDVQFGDEVRLLLDATAADFANPGTASVIADVGGGTVRYIRVTATKLAPRQNDYIFALGELRAVNAATGDNIALGALVTATDSIESGERWAAANLTDGLFYRSGLSPEENAELMELKKQLAAIAERVRPKEIDAQLAQIEQQLKVLNVQRESLPNGKFVYAAATEFSGGGTFMPTEGTPRTIHLLDRGDLRSPIKPVRPGAPKLWDDAPTELVADAEWREGDARAALARYLTRKDNPLLWRSFANRLWQWTFGQPLVGTPNDFGRMGMKPTHPELLDYLAASLRDDPEQSIKRIVRLLVTSQAYRRSSRESGRQATVDSQNQLLWRFHRRRLTAEEFRDSVLAISGALRLDPRGGPSFRDFLIQRPEHSPHYRYDLHDPADPATHRRTIYRFVVRSQPQPMLTLLDCADPSISVARRDESTTALQALTQWNSRLVEAMSRAFAQRLRDEAEASADDQIDLACRLAWGRTPEPDEHTVLRELLEDEGQETLCRVLLNTSAFTYID